MTWSYHLDQLLIGQACLHVPAPLPTTEGATRHGAIHQAPSPPTLNSEHLSLPLTDPRARVRGLRTVFPIVE